MTEISRVSCSGPIFLVDHTQPNWSGVKANERRSLNLSEQESTRPIRADLLGLVLLTQAAYDSTQALRSFPDDIFKIDCIQHGIMMCALSIAYNPYACVVSSLVFGTPQSSRLLSCTWHTSRVNPRWVSTLLCTSSTPESQRRPAQLRLCD